MGEKVFMTVRDNLISIEKDIKRACEKVNRSTEDITLIGVTKYVTIDRAKELLDTNVKNLGENRAEELAAKYEEIGQEANWHFIGTLQSRKVKDVIDKVTAIHSLDRLSVAKQIDKRSEKTMDCFIQVNVSGEEAKHGLEPEEVMDFVKELAQFEKVRVVGLMTMAPHIEDKVEIRGVFRKLREIRDDIASYEFSHAPCPYLSMGMSNDYDIAIEEVATHIRIGSKLVGS